MTPKKNRRGGNRRRRVGNPTPNNTASIDAGQPIDPPPLAPCNVVHEYAFRRMPVVPLHSIRGSQCSCGKVDCDSPGKHPRTKNGLKDASADLATIDRWWGRWPDANIGVCTGSASGIVVLDVDPRHGGADSLTELERVFGPLPPTVETITGGGGRHLFFKHPGGTVRNRSNIHPGVDVRGDGGYVVAAPSVHVSGGAYSWRPGRGPGEIGLAEIPGWLLPLLTTQNRRAPAPTTTTTDVTVLLKAAGQYVSKAASATEGSRNNAAFGLAGHVFAFQTEAGARLTEGQVLDVLRTWNHRNAPPLSDHELGQAVHSAGTNGERRAPHIVRAGKQRSAEPMHNDGKSKPGRDLRNSRLDRAALESAPTRRPFPVEALPEPIRSLVIQAAVAIGCDVTMIAPHALAACAAMIGTTRRIVVKAGWHEPSVLWTAVVAESGTLKSPALDVVRTPVHRRQAEMFREHQAAMESYEQERLEYEKALSGWRSRKSDVEPPPEKPQSPPAQRIVCADITIEALASILSENPRGVLVVRDELSGWLNGFDAYRAKSRGGVDAAHYLEMHRAAPLIVDRKTGDKKMVHVPRAAVSICGTIQPGTLRRALRLENVENGLAARILFVHPPERTKRWTDATISRAAVDAFDDVLGKLLGLNYNAGPDGHPVPVDVPLDEGARAAWINFYQRFARRQGGTHDPALRSALSKIEGAAARFSLLVHLIRWAAGEPWPSDAIDAAAVEAGVALAEWFADEQERIYVELAETDDESERHELLRFIVARGGAATVRDIQQFGPMQFRRRAGEVADLLDALADDGAGRWEHPAPGESGGRPTKIFRLLRYETPTDDAETPCSVATQGQAEPEPVGAGREVGEI